MTADAHWHLYVLRCDGRRLYTGISTDVERRLKQHRGLAAGAKFTKACKTLELVYSVAIGDRSLASRAEARFKRLSAARKRQVIAQMPSSRALLSLLGIDC